MALHLPFLFTKAVLRMRFICTKGFFAALFLLLILVTNAQPGCPAINPGNNVSLPCGTNCTTLRATPFDAGSTTSYEVSAIAYTPFSYTAGTSVLVNIDDIWGSVINLPFNFCFFGHVYDQAVIGANGIITFNTYRAGQYNQWDITAANPIPDASTIDSGFTNSIMCPYQDIDPALGGSITYQIIGTAPCRIFIVSFNGVPMFDSDNFLSNCYGTTNTTCQAAIYETTNVIEMYIQDKQSCTDWNSGYAIEGIMDSSGANAAFVPGRNLSVWDAHNDAYRFTPNGPSIVSVSWYKGATQISTDSFVTVCPSQNTTYTAKAVYTPCAGGTPVTVTGSVTVSLSGSLQAGVDSVKNISCSNPTGSAYASASTANSGLAYGWSNGATTLSITNLTAGTYVFTASDASGCTRSDTAHITTFVPLTATVASTQATSCTGTGSGSLIVQAGGGNSPYTYHWINGETGVSDTAIAPGNYTVTVTDVTGCTITASGTFTVNTGGNTVVLNNPTIKNISCFNQNNGSIIAHVSGGSSPYHYVWSNTQNGDTAISLAASSYTVTATDAGGCTASATYNVTQPTQLIMNAAAIQNIGCGVYTGSIRTSAAGGTTPYAYNWTEQSNSASLTGSFISNLIADTYTLTVTDANLCIDTISYIITQSRQLIIASDSVSTTCHGSSDGSVAISILSGTAPYSFIWDGAPATTDSTLSNLPAGPVEVIVTDSTNCSIDRFITVNQPTAVTINLVSTTNVSCNGGSNGTITVSASGGRPGYIYNWVNTVTGATDTALAAGSYSVTATDLNQCTASATYSVSQPTALSINTPNIQNIGCSGGNTGSITANVTQGTPPYTYKWALEPAGPFYTGQTISNLGVGTYLMGVKDANGCIDTASYSITAIPLLTFTATSTPTSCFGGNNGTAHVSVTSGTPPYQYTYNNQPAVTDSNTSNLTAGQLLIIVTDGNGCLTQNTIAVTQPTALSITKTSQTNVVCFGGNNGELVVTASGGTPGYSFTWSNQFVGTDNTNLIAGIYTVALLDNNDCPDTAQYIITQPTQLVTTPTAKNALCNSGNDGSIDVNPSGGTPLYAYLWSNGETTRVATGLVKGSYDATVTDANGCKVIAVDTIGEPAPMVISDSATAVKCIGQKSGTIIVSATGDTPPYAYYATQDDVNFTYATNGVILGLDTGIYKIVVSDSFGCSNVKEAYVPPAIPDEFFPPVVDSTLCYGPEYNDGAVLVLDSTIQNGPYQYAIDGGALQDSGYFQNLSAGPHVVVAVNHNGCADSIPVVVPEPLPIVAVVTPDSVTLPLGGSQAVLVTYLNATSPSYNWVNTLGFSCTDCPNPVVSGYESGEYVVVVSMQNGAATCYGSTTLHVTVGTHTKAFAPNAFTPNGDGNNDVFQIYGEDIKTVSMKVFNRWGELVYTTNSLLSGWDGTYKGVLQNPAVFTYIANITYLDDTQETKKGTVTLIR